MLDHIKLIIHDYDRSKQFYQLALAPLGYELVLEMAGWAGFGWGDKPELMIRGGSSTAPAVHIAFRAEDRETVQAFYDAALQAGGKEKDAPASRPEYHQGYYSAVVLDPDGHKIEVVCHIPADAFE